jgi:S1-C subfamily serine protease
MNTPIRLIALFVFGLCLLPWQRSSAGTTPPPAVTPSTPNAAPAKDANYLVRVNSTNQAHDFLRPWQKKNAFRRNGLGVLVGENEILVTAELVANHNYIELEHPSGGAKSQAKIRQIDYDANLALLEAVDADFLSTFRPVGLDQTARVGDSVVVMQLEGNGDLAATPATITQITVGAYAVEDVGMLIYRLSLALQQRDGSFVIPAMRNGKLLGLIMRYDGRNQTADVIPAPIIEKFLQMAREEIYAGFPRAGYAYVGLRDPQLRDFVGLQANGGVFITRVSPGSAAEESGLQEGDVLKKIGGHTIDNDGNFQHPRFGRIPIGHLTTAESAVDEVVPLTVFRDGENMELSMRLKGRDRDQMPVPIHIFDSPPRYAILGGVVFQELSRPFLREFGPDWRNNAPQDLVYYDIFQEEVLKDRKGVVFINQPLPLSETVGLDNIAGSVIARVNDRTVETIEELIAAMESTKSTFHKIELESDPGVFFLPVDDTEELEKTIQNNLGIERLRHTR